VQAINEITATTDGNKRVIFIIMVTMVQDFIDSSVRFSFVRLMMSLANTEERYALSPSHER
jgi:hypothetical protein